MSYMIANSINFGISELFILKDVLVPTRIIANMRQAKINRYKIIEGNSSPAAITGSVNKGINPNVEEDRIPYANPLIVSLFISCVFYAKIGYFV